MNHASLDLPFEPNKVNFITGRNGAGKSSVIQVCLSYVRIEKKWVLFTNINYTVSFRPLCSLSVATPR